MVAQHAVPKPERIEHEEPVERIVLSARDTQAIFAAMDRPAVVNPKTAEAIRKADQFRQRHGVESTR